MWNTIRNAIFTVAFAEFSKRKITKGGELISTSDIMNTVRELLVGNPGVRVVVDKDAAGPPMGKAINIDLSGDDFSEIVNESEKMLSFINSKSVEGVEDLKINIQTGKPELIINIDEQKARRLNLSTAQIGMTIRTALFGKEISKFKVDSLKSSVLVKERLITPVASTKNK